VRRNPRPLRYRLLRPPCGVPTPAQAAVLHCSLAGQPLDTGLRGRVAAGGHAKVLVVIRRWGWLDHEDHVTAEGREALRRREAWLATMGECPS